MILYRDCQDWNASLKKKNKYGIISFAYLMKTTGIKLFSTIENIGFISCSYNFRRKNWKKILKIKKYI